MAKKTLSSTTEPLHRGRFQAQGSGVQKNEPWAQSDALKYPDGTILLSNLEKQLLPAEKAARIAGIAFCQLEIKRMNSNGGYTVTSGVYKKSFPNGKEDRIDLDIFKGSAFQ